MGGVRGGWRKQLTLMLSSTPSIFCRTSLFQNLKTLNPWLQEPCIAPNVVIFFFFGMLAAIYFDNQSFIKGDEINNVIPDG